MSDQLFERIFGNSPGLSPPNSQDMAEKIFGKGPPPATNPREFEGGEKKRARKTFGFSEKPAQDKPKPVNILTAPAPSRPALSHLVRKTARVTMGLPFKEISESSDGLDVELKALKLPPMASESELIAKVYELLETGKTRLAYAVANRAHEGSKMSKAMAEMWTALGNAYFDEGNMERTYQSFFHAYQHEQGTLAAEFNMGIGYQGKGEFDKARVHYTKACEIDGRNPKVWCNLGVLSFQQNKSKDSERCLRKAIRLNERYARAWDNLGAVLGAENRIPEALEACARALELNAGLKEAWFKVGLMTFERGDMVESEIAFAHADGLEPVQAYIDYYIGLLHLRRGQPAQALRRCETAFQRDETCEVGLSAWSELLLYFETKGDPAQTAICRKAFERLKASVSS